MINSSRRLLRTPNRSAAPPTSAAHYRQRGREASIELLPVCILASLAVRNGNPPRCYAPEEALRSSSTFSGPDEIAMISLSRSHGAVSSRGPFLRGCPGSRRGDYRISNRQRIDCEVRSPRSASPIPSRIGAKLTLQRAGKSSDIAIDLTDPAIQPLVIDLGDSGKCDGINVALRDAAGKTVFEKATSPVPQVQIQSTFTAQGAKSDAAYSYIEPGTDMRNGGAGIRRSGKIPCARYGRASARQTRSRAQGR